MEIKDYFPDGSDIDEEEYKTLHPQAGYQSIHGKKGGGKKWLLILLAVLLLAGLGFGAYKLLSHKTTKASTKGNQSQNIPKPSEVTGNGLTTYTAPTDGLGLSFDYPSSWVVTPTSGQPGTTITATSLLVSLTDATGSKATGKVVVTVSASATNPTGKGPVAAKAAQDSVQYAYTAPTPIQHQYYYVSFLHFPNAAATVGAFEEVAITGINLMPKDTAITSDLLGSVNPVISAVFYKCSTQDCTGTGQSLLSISNSTWQSNATMQAVQKLFESFKFN
ncbi:MAG: hypothetical protein WC498_04150 [Candidatus Saccharimonadales bacterium]